MKNIQKQLRDVFLKFRRSKERGIIMLIFIGALILTIIGVLLLIKKDSAIGMILILVMGVTTFVCGIAALTNFIDADNSYQDALYEKHVLEYRLSHMDDNIIGNEMIYDDIVEFNNRLRDNKDRANSLFYGWFYNKKVATIEYIEISIDK